MTINPNLPEETRRITKKQSEILGRKLAPPPFQSWTTICPYCLSKSSRLINSDLTKFICQSCGKNFTIQIATVRAKLSRKIAAAFRQYQIRIITHSGEKELYIKDYYSDNLPMRSGDLIYVAYSQNNQPLLIFNDTISTFSRIKIWVRSKYWPLDIVGHPEFASDHY